MLNGGNALASNLNRGAFVSSCVSTLADIAWKERDAITNVSINKLICYTKPVALDGFGVISLVIVIDDIGRATIPEVHIVQSEQDFIREISKLRNYTTHVCEANTASLQDGVSIEYAARTGVHLTNYVSVGLSSMQVFSQIVEECLAALNNYFAAVGYNADTILYGFDRPTNDILHENNVYQFLNAELVIAINMFRVDMNGQLDYDFNIGLLLSAMRSGKNDSKFKAVKF